MNREFVYTLAPLVPGRLEFTEPGPAELFTKEIAESLEGVLTQNFVYYAHDPFVRTSVPPRVCHDHLWSRDAGVLLRELAAWGYLGHACYLADILLRLVEPNKDGFFSFPMYFLRGQKATGTELDGTAAIVIALTSLCGRLPKGNATRLRIEKFLMDSTSPVRYILHVFKEEPLVAGTGEFGGGMGIEGEFYNVVQNNLVMLSLLKAASLYQELDAALADVCRVAAGRLHENILRLLVSEDGRWIWCVDTKTQKPDPAVLSSDENRNFGGVNGVLAMSADALGFDSAVYDPRVIEASEKTFLNILSEPKRWEQFQKYGIYTQFDRLHDGLLTSPAYGQGYALQVSILLGRLDLTDKLAGFLASATFAPPAPYNPDRTSPYHFYERMLSPDYTNLAGFDQGCGALNLVNVAEPLKAARLMAGIDDTNPNQLLLIPKLPLTWNGVKAAGWPVFTSGGITRCDMEYQKSGGACELTFSSELPISRVSVKLQGEDGQWRESHFENVRRFVI